MSRKIIIPEQIVQKAYAYYQQTGSLSKTAKWLNQGCPNVAGDPTSEHIVCTRHPLSRIFKNNGFDVKLPNGQTVGDQKPRPIKTSGTTRSKKRNNIIQDPTMKFCVSFYETLWLDIKRPSKENPHYFLSACYFFIYDPRHETFCDYLNLDYRRVPRDMRIPRGLLRDAADQYLRFIEATKNTKYYRFWLSNDDTIQTLFREVAQYAKS